MMAIKLEHINEPRLLFGDYFEHEDTKTGLAEYGPFGKNVPGLHKTEIKLGFIGTRNTISGAKEWIEKCSGYVESENIKKIVSKTKGEDDLLGDFFGEEFVESNEFKRLDKILNRDFEGFNKDSAFNSCFLVNPRWDRVLNHRELDNILNIEDKEERIGRVADLIDSELKSLTETDPSPDIIIIALTKKVAEVADTVRVSENFFLNLRRLIKARAMNQKKPVPVQIILERTISGTGDVQEPATRAWNFCTAQYYKAGGIPWVPTTLGQDTCFIGISFYVARGDNNKFVMQSSLAQAYDFLGQGLILRGEPFVWDIKKFGRSPHLTRDAASKLIRETLKEYVDVKGAPPRRVVIHKTSEFWGDDKPDYNEVEGLYSGIDAVAPNCESDFVALRQTGVRLFREGTYPPLRGTIFSVNDADWFLYTMGFIPYLETYPSSHVPEPWQIVQHVGGSSKKDLFREVLALTKMNVNNCAFADGIPITISFSRKVGDIMKHVGVNDSVQSSYRFYM